MKKKYFQIILICLAAIFMLIAITLFIQIRTLQEETEEPTEIVQVKDNKELEQMKRKAHASELLALALNAYHQNDQRNFQGYMASLEGYADALSDDALEIYHELENALRGKNND